MVATRFEIKKLDAAHLDGAARLAAARNARMRGAESGLWDAWSTSERARADLESILATPGAHGVVAIRNATVVGYLVGTELTGGRFGSAAWVELSGHAVDAATDADLARDMYAAWAPHFTERGVTIHMVHVAEVDAAVMRAWFELGFGQMHASAMRETNADDLATSAGVEIRRIGPDDNALVLGTFATLIGAHQARTPSFAPYSEERAAADRADWEEELTESTEIWLAVDEATGEPLGLTLTYVPDAGPAVPEHATYLGSTATLPAARGRGVGRALLRRVLESGRERGATHCTTNWRTSNLEASRTWPRLGFRRTHVRLRRDIDPLARSRG